MFSRQVQEDRVTRTFASAHFRYLRDQADEDLQTLAKAQSSNGHETVLQEARMEASALREELTKLSDAPAGNAVDRMDEIQHKSKSLEDSLR